jgi:hypothetical protein
MEHNLNHSKSPKGPKLTGCAAVPYCTLKTTNIEITEPVVTMQSAIEKLKL